MKKLIKYLSDYKKECVLGPLFKMLEAIFELFIPLVVASVIDVGIAAENKAMVFRLFGVLIALGIIGLICAVSAQYFAAKASAGFAKKVKSALFTKIQSLSYSEIDSVGTSSLITNMTSDINQVQTGVNLTLRLLLRTPFIVFGSIVMAFTVNADAALVFVVTVPVLSCVVFGIMLGGIPLYRKVQSCVDIILNKTRENLSGVRVVRAFCKESDETQSFIKENDRLSKIQTTAGKISALLNPVTFLIINLAIIVLMNVGAVKVNNGFLTSGQVVALYNYMSQILVELIKLANLIITVTKAVACGNRIEKVLELPPENAGGAVINGLSAEEAVSFRDVSLYYPQSSKASLENICFTAKKGQTVGIIGGTGSGKTSLVNLIAGFYDYTGEILVSGVNLHDYSKTALLDKIGLVPQNAVLFSGTVRDNMKWGNAEASDTDIEAALKTAQAWGFISDKDGLDTVVEQGGKNFSGGQRQRLTIARALVKNPEILILDDSSSALDYATDAALRKAISGMKCNATVFIVSQRTASVRHADLIIVLDNGKVVGTGKHKQLLESCNVYREIYDSQFKGGDDQ